MFTQLIYASQPFGYDAPTLAGILATARRRNPQLGITGALVCRMDIYLQLLEGPAQEIDQLYESILSDSRHMEVTLLHRTEVETRMFPDWAMLHDPAHSWHWSADDINDGAVKKATPEELQDIFKRIAAGVATDPAVP